MVREVHTTFTTKCTTLAQYLSVRRGREDTIGRGLCCGIDSDIIASSPGGERTMQPLSIAVPTALALALVLACARTEEKAETAPAIEPVVATDPTTRATMGRIAEAMRVALPFALDAERFADPANRESIRTALADLASSAAALEAHAASNDSEASFLSRSLASDAADVAARFDAGRDAEARFLMTLLIDNCFACHSRTPDAEARDLGALLLADVDAQALDSQELAFLQAATRQFDAALDTWEEMFRAPEPGPTELARQGLVVDYLIIAIRVKDDLERPRAALEGLAARGDTPDLLRAQLLAWSAALVELAALKPAGSELEAARALIDASDQRRGEPHDSTGLVHEIAASAHLHRLLASGAPPVEQRAEAFYLLGLVESRIRQSSWILQAEFYLESAIRTAPGGPFARAAYDLLEQEILADYSGSAGDHLPDEIQGRLTGLADLIAGAPPSP